MSELEWGKYRKLRGGGKIVVLRAVRGGVIEYAARYDGAMNGQIYEMGM